MKALSLHQPYASLIPWGEKKIETRSWQTTYRGELAIHAAQRRFTRSDIVTMKEVFFAVASRHIADIADLPYGSVLCVVRLLDVIPTAPNLPDTWARLGLTQQEFMFGNYAPGRFAWMLELIEVFRKPIPARGARGLFQWTRP